MSGLRTRLVGPAAATVAAGYATMQWLGRTYGSTPAERRAALPGDGIVAFPQIEVTHAGTIPAPPAAVWPWLMQVGWGRAGWYTPRWVDRMLFPANGPSAQTLLPRYDGLAVGDFVPDGPPETECGFVVAEVKRDRHLVLHSTSHLPLTWRKRGLAGIDWTWSFVLTPVDGGRRTRLVFRWRSRTTPAWMTAAAQGVLVPADAIMSRGMLRGLAARVGAERARGGVVSLMGASPDGVDLYWLPLGAGDNTHCVRTNGRIYEALSAAWQRRNRCALYHAALIVHLDGEQYAIEMGPAWGVDDPDRGVVCVGPVGMRWLGRSRLFRYEVRCWRGGEIPDASEAVESPQRISSDPGRAKDVLALASEFPSATWGRDELGAGEMWNSNSLVAWLLARSGHDVESLRPPGGGRAPGWLAGLRVAGAVSPEGRTARWV
jgi:hypothetical protein